jgi:hypothetical protein
MKEIDSYLNDHLAGSVGALELIGHCAHLYEGKSLGIFFADMKAQIGADQETLRNLMYRLGIEESKARQAGAWAGEKVGRALFTLAGNKPNGVGLVLVLEGLVMGVSAKRLLWRTLSAANLPKLNDIDFEQLQRRAEEQIKRVQAEQFRSARRALTDRRSLAT